MDQKLTIGMAAAQEALADLAAEDELWILGDICKPTVAAAKELRAAIPCERVHIVIGNHDTGSKFNTAGGYTSVDYYAQVGKVAREGYKFVMSYGMVTAENYPNGTLLAV